MSEPRPELEGPGPHADAAAWVLGALDPLGGRTLRRSPRELRGLPQGGPRAAAGARVCSAWPRRLSSCRPASRSARSAPSRAAAAEQPVRRSVAQAGDAPVVGLAERRGRPRPSPDVARGGSRRRPGRRRRRDLGQRQNASAPPTVTIALQAPNGGRGPGRGGGREHRQRLVRATHRERPFARSRREGALRVLVRRHGRHRVSPGRRLRGLVRDPARRHLR